MTEPTQPIAQIRQFAASLKRHPRLWLGPAVAATSLAVLYALFAPHAWKASQALMVREEAGGTAGRQGRFDSSDAMKNAQETILELARNNTVVTAALSQAGPPPDCRDPQAWPAPDDVRAAQDAIAVTAPQGAEFGRTEVIYLSVAAAGRQRAIDLAGAVCGALDSHLQGLRDRKAKSLVAELQKQARLAQADLDEATRKLQAMESEVGSDLGELRNLNDSGRGDSNLRITMARLKDAVRAARAALVARQQQLDLLASARQDPHALVSAPNELLESQPALRRLKEGLVDAQLRTAQILGQMSADHPLAKAALAAEQEVKQKLHKELEAATLGLQADLKMGQVRADDLDRQLADVQGRLDRLAGLRATYANLVNEVRQKGEVLEKTNKALADAQASRAAAQSCSLLTRLDAPQADTRPIGPSRALVVLGGLLGGLLAGAGLVFLLDPPVNAQGRRWTDRLKFGRRASDPPTGRRATDPAPTGRRGEDPKPARRGEDQPSAPPAVAHAAASQEEELCMTAADLPAPLVDRRSGQERRKGG